MGRQPFRVAPNLPAGAMKTYQILAPPATHWRPATCAEIDCQPYRLGWASTVLPGSDMEATLLRAADGMVDGHRRRWSSRHRQEDGFVRYVFASGQLCFKAASHKVRQDRPEIFVVRDGDWRGNPRRTDPYRHRRAADWVDDFASHQQGLANRLERG